MTIRFGLLGTGYWAAETQGAALAVHPEVEFVGVWGRSADKAGELAGRYGTTAYHDVDALLADVDAVAIALPPDIQASLAQRAATAGRHLLLDKPLALSTAAAQAVVTEVGRQGVASVVFFTRRFTDSVDQFIRDASAAGTWDGARCVMYAGILGEGSPYAHSPWRHDKGGLWDLGPHALAVLLPVLGTVAEVSAFHGPHASTHVLLRHHSGAVSSLALTLDAPEGAQEYETVFFGEPGRLVVPADDRSAVEAFGVAISDLIAAAGATGAGHPLDVHFGYEVVAILEAAERSAKEGVTVAM